mgnify:FL=1
MPKPWIKKLLTSLTTAELHLAVQSSICWNDVLRAVGLPIGSPYRTHLKQIISTHALDTSHFIPGSLVQSVKANQNPKTICPICKTQEKSKRRGYCLDCSREKSLNRYYGNRERLQAQARKRVQEITDMINELKSAPCTDCNQKFPPVCMDFDRRDPPTKISEISTLRRTASVKIITNEILKCDLVCSNCHRLRTQKRGTYS